jgi:hypothetical protein
LKDDDDDDDDDGKTREPSTKAIIFAGKSRSRVETPWIMYSFCLFAAVIGR